MAELLPGGGCIILQLHASLTCCIFTALLTIAFKSDQRIFTSVCVCVCVCESVREREGRTRKVTLLLLICIASFFMIIIMGYRASNQYWRYELSNSLKVHKDTYIIYNND